MYPAIHPVVPRDVSEKFLGLELRRRFEPRPGENAQIFYVFRTISSNNRMNNLVSVQRMYRDVQKKPC